MKTIHVKKWNFGNASLSLVALMVILIVVGAATLSTMQALNKAWHWEKHTYEVSSELERLLSNLVDVETAERGYAISGDQKFLEPFNNARPQIDGSVQNLRRFTIDNAIQQRRLEQLGLLIEKRIAEAQHVIDARANGDSEAAQMRVSGGEGKRVMDAIRQIIVEMKSEEQRLLSDRSHAANAAVQRLQGTLYGSSALGVLIVVLSFLLTAHESRKRRQAEVSANRTLSILDFTRDGVFMFEASTLRFFYVNDGAVQLVGYTREELLGMTPLDLKPPEFDAPRYRALIAPLLDGRLGTQTSSTLYRRKNGMNVPVEIILQSSKNVAGAQSLVAIVRDVTERMQVEESKRVLRQAQLLDLAHDAILVCDPNDRITFWNPAAERHYGWSREEALGKHTHSFLHTVFPRPLEEIEAIMLKEGYWQGELQHTTRDGSQIIVSSRWSLERDEGGSPASTLEINNDITERKRAEEALLVNRAKLDAAWASMTDAVFISDTEGRFIEFNEAFATFHKFRDKTECAKTLAEYPAFLDVFMANGELVPLDQWAVPRALRGETATNVEFTLRRKDTGETWVGSYSFAPICDKGGEIVGSVVLGRDVTERKGVEEALRQSEERFRTMANSIPQLAWIAQADGYIYWYNQRWYEYTGTTPEQMEGWGWQCVHDPLVLPKVLEQWQASIATGEPFDMEFPLRGADGVSTLPDPHIAPQGCPGTNPSVVWNQHGYH